MSSAGDKPTADEFDEGFPRYVRKSVDQTNTTTTIADDSELILSVDANTTYEVEEWIVVNSPAATDYKYQHTVPAGASGWWNPRVRNLTAAADTIYQGTLAWGTQAQLEGSASDLVMQVSGVLVVAGTAGTIKAQWASNAAGTTAVRANSYIKLTKMP